MHGEARGLVDGTRETADLERELREHAQGGWQATCTGERADRGPAPSKQQTDREPGARATKHLTELQNSGVLTGSRLRPGARSGQLAVDSVRNTKDGDAPALEVRAGTPGVGCTARDAAGLSSTKRNRVKVARTSEKNDPRSPCA